MGEGVEETGSGVDVVTIALRRAADSVKPDASSIQLADVLQGSQTPGRQRQKTHWRPVKPDWNQGARTPSRRSAALRIAWAALVLALVGGVVASISLTGSPSGSHPPASQTIPVGHLSQFEVVAPGGGQSSERSPIPPIDVIDPVTGVVHRVQVPGFGGIKFPWVVEGVVVVTITDLPSGNSAEIGGTAIAWRPGERMARSLGRASDVIPSVTPGAVWLVSEHGGDSLASAQCDIREETITDRALSPYYPMDCKRWLIGAVSGGLLSAPDQTNADSFTWDPNPDAEPSSNLDLQVWDPATDRVVRTLARNAAWDFGASDQYVEWQTQDQQTKTDQAEANQKDPTAAVQLSDVKNGATRTFIPKVDKGMVVEGGPVLAPVGPFVAYSEVTLKEAKLLAGSSISPPCCIEPVESVTGRMIVENFATGKVVLNRVAPVSSEGVMWTTDDSFLVTTTDAEHIAFIPAWSADAQVTTTGAPIESSFADAEDFTIVTRS